MRPITRWLWIHAGIRCRRNVDGCTCSTHLRRNERDHERADCEGTVSFVGSSPHGKRRTLRGGYFWQDESDKLNPMPCALLPRAPWRSDMGFHLARPSASQPVTHLAIIMAKLNSSLINLPSSCQKYPTGVRGCETPAHDVAKPRLGRGQTP